jgi:hypothetical protein
VGAGEDGPIVPFGVGVCVGFIATSLSWIGRSFENRRGGEDLNLRALCTSHQRHVDHRRGFALQVGDLAGPRRDDLVALSRRYVDLKLVLRDAGGVRELDADAVLVGVRRHRAHFHVGKRFCNGKRRIRQSTGPDDRLSFGDRML